MALGGEIVNLIGLHLLHDVDQTTGIGHVTVMQHKLATLYMRVLIQMIDTIRVEEGGPAFYAVDFIAFLQQKFSQVGPILTSDTRDQCFLCHFHFVRLYLSSNRTMSSSPR